MTLTTIAARAEWCPGMMADVAAAVGRRAAAVREDVYETILREIPQLGDDKPLLALLALLASNVDTCLQIMGAPDRPGCRASPGGGRGIRAAAGR